MSSDVTFGGRQTSTVECLEISQAEHVRLLKFRLMNFRHHLIPTFAPITTSLLFDYNSCMNRPGRRHVKPADGTDVIPGSSDLRADLLSTSRGSNFHSRPSFLLTTETPYPHTQNRHHVSASQHVARYPESAGEQIERGSYVLPAVMSRACFFSSTLTFEGVALILVL